MLINFVRNTLLSSPTPNSRIRWNSSAIVTFQQFNFITNAHGISFETDVFGKLSGGEWYGDKFASWTLKRSMFFRKKLEKRGRKRKQKNHFLTPDVIVSRNDCWMGITGAWQKCLYVWERDIYDLVAFLRSDLWNFDCTAGYSNRIVVIPVFDVTIRFMSHDERYDGQETSSEMSGYVFGDLTRGLIDFVFENRTPEIIRFRYSVSVRNWRRSFSLCCAFRLVTSQQPWPRAGWVWRTSDTHLS